MRSPVETHNEQLTLQELDQVSGGEVNIAGVAQFVASNAKAGLQMVLDTAGAIGNAVTPAGCPDCWTPHHL